MTQKQRIKAAVAQLREPELSVLSTALTQYIENSDDDDDEVIAKRLQSAVDWRWAQCFREV